MPSLRLATAMGAVFSFGTNNLTDQPKGLARWTEAIATLDLQPDDLWHPRQWAHRTTITVPMGVAS